MHTLRSCSSQLFPDISLWINVGRALLLPKAIPQPPMSPKLRQQPGEKNITWWCSLACSGIQKGSSSCKDCSAPRPGHANSPGFHIAGCWVWQCSRLSSGIQPSLDKKVAATLVPPFTSAPHRLHTHGWEVQDGWGAQARHQHHPGCGFTGELQPQQSCAQTSAPPAWGTSRRCTHREVTKNSLTQPRAPGTFMRNLQVHLTKQLLLKTQGSSGGEPGQLSRRQGGPQGSPGTKVSKWGKHSAALF